MPIHSSTSHNGAIAVPGLADGGELALTGEQTFSTTGTSNDVALNGGVSVFRYTGATAATFTGFAGGYNGRILLIVNESSGSAPIQLSHVTGSAAANQILGLTAANASVTYEGGAVLRYDGTNSKWRIVALATTTYNSVITAGGGLSSSSTLTASATLLLTSSTSPTAISGTNNDWAPTSAYRYRISASAAATITGLATAVAPGRWNWFQNTSAFNITLTNEGTGSTAANRFTCPRSVDLVIPPNGNAYLIYDTTTSRWIVFGDASCWNQGASTLSGDLISPPWVSGRYYYAPNGSNASSITFGANNQMRASPFYVPNTVTITRLGAEVAVVGEAGSKVRLGIYGDDGTGQPGALIVDAGQIAGDSATVQEITGLSVTIGPGWYWSAWAAQSAPTTRPQMRVNLPPITANTDAGTTLPSASNASFGFRNDSVSGALPSPFAQTGGSGTGTRLIVKI